MGRPSVSMRGRRRAWLGAVLSSALAAGIGAVIGCGGPARTATPILRRDGAAAALLSSIEGDASECTVVRPTLLSDRRRALLARWRERAALGYGWEDPAAPRVLAYASCVVGDDEGAWLVTRVRLATPLDEQMREALIAALPFDARWTDAPCDEVSCRWRAVRAVSPHVVEIRVATQGYVERSRPDVRRVLGAELSSRPELIEATAVQVGGSGLLVLETLERIPRGVGLATRIVGTDERIGLAESEVVDALLARLEPRIARPELGWRVRGEAFERFLPMPWTLVEAEVGDARIERETRLRLAARDRVVPYDEIALDEPRALRRQAGARARAARVTRDPERRRTLLEERAALLARTFDLTEEVAAAADAIALWLDLGQDERARELAARAYALRPESLELRAAWVHAAAREPSTLGDVVAALRPDLSPSEREELAHAAARALPTGVGWATLEASFDTARARSALPVRVAPVRLPTGALVELGYVLLRAQGARGPLRVRLEGRLASDGPRAVDLLGVRWAGASPGREVWGTVASDEPTLERLRWLSTALRAQLPSFDGEPVELSVYAGEVAITLRLSMTAEGDAELIAASRPLATARWADLAREVARPLERLEGTRFPLPVLSLALGAHSLERARTALVPDHGGSLDGGACELRASTLVCTGRERGPEALLDVLAVVARASID
ncbi:MAG: hypothetical protein OHK0013_06420 [Sandaracinaceae bacterium]